jgi:DNA-binding transcriptional ArsR family regulator
VSWPTTSTPPDVEALAEHVFVALADPTRRAILAALAAEGPATATDLAGRLPITRQAVAKHLALLAEAGLVLAEPGERRRVRFRLRSAPMQVAQQFLAALARDWDGPLGALRDHLDRRAGEPGTTPPRGRGRGPDQKGEQEDEDSADRDAAGVGGGASAVAREGEGSDPGPGRAGRTAPADAMGGG